MTEWKPIRTAPKDGRTILIYGYWMGELGGVGDEKSIWMASYGRSGWCIDGSEYYAAYVKQPTHWAPLPEPPK